MAIHPTASISPGADIDPTAEIGPFCVVGPHVIVGAHTRLIAHVMVHNRVILGSGNTVHPFATIGGPPQDLKFNGEPARLIIGDHNVIREGVTLNIGTAGGHLQTIIGNNCFFMANSHVAHDCVIGDRVVCANSVGLAGHVTVNDDVIIGGLAAVHQFCSIGRRAFLAGGAMVTQDVPPFCMAKGDRAQLMGINIVGLRRIGWSNGRLHAIRRAFKTIFNRETVRHEALAVCELELAGEFPEVAEMIAFIRAAKRGVCNPAGTPDTDTD